VVVGGAGGAIAARVMKTVGGAIIRRKLEERQETRAGAAFHAAHLRVFARILRGDDLRDDGFFEADPTPGGRLRRSLRGHSGRQQKNTRSERCPSWARSGEICRSDQT
jgi:hypothetical protein